MNLSALIKQGQERLKNKSLGLILLGPSGSGKSRACGTLGVKTLYLHTSGESHGPASAAGGGSEILPICIDKDGDKILTPDESYQRLLQILAAKDELKKLGVGAVALDGATELEALIQSTNVWKERLKNEYKGVKAYAGDLTLSMFRPILVALQDLQKELNVHYVLTCILHVREVGENNEILDAAPALYGFQVATGLIQQFADVMVIGQVFDGERLRPAFQLGSSVSKATKDQQTKEVRKLANFHCRLTGADLSEAPALMKPDLARLAKVKAEGKYV